MLTRTWRATRRIEPILLGILAAQACAHLLWLSISTDSGQIAVPWMMSRGMVLFDTLIEHRGPLRFFVVVAAARLSPFDLIATAKLLNLALVLSTTVFVYLVAARLGRDNRRVAGYGAAITWLLWEPVYGNVLFYFDAMLGWTVICALTAWLFLEDRRPTWLAPVSAGVLMGVATVCKQHGVLALVVFGIWMIAAHPRGRPRRWQDVLLYAAAALVIPVASCGYFWSQGTLGGYVHWIWSFNLTGDRPWIERLDGSFLRKLLFSCALVPPFVLAARQQPSGSRWWLIASMALALLLTILPSPGELHVMAALPCLAVMSGLTLGLVAPSGDLRVWRARARVLDPRDAVMMGLLILVLVGWGVTCLAPYMPGQLPRGRAPAYDELGTLADRIRLYVKADDTLYVVPELESTAQLHVMTGLLPPRTWAYGNRWLLQSPGMVERLLREWRETPPEVVAYFPRLAAEQGAAITPLVDFVRARYEQVDRVDEVLFAGDAIVYRYRRFPE